MKLILSRVQRFSTADGPGIRTTVFFAGCNLTCKWCHNPETQSFQPQVLRFSTGKEECSGTETTVQEIFALVKKDSDFYTESGGGVTLSGGEPLLQAEFACKVFSLCKENGIHTAVDTAGHVPYERFEQILPYTDLFLYDVKCFDSDKHRQYTGVENQLILKNLKRLLAKSTPVWIRIPIIPTVNDTEKELQRIKEYLSSCGIPEKVELLPYDAMGEHKYAAIGKETQIFSVPSEEKMKHLKNIFS